MSEPPTQSAKGIEWLTNIPPGWPSTTLGRVGRFHMGTTFPHAYQGATQGDLPFIKVSDFPHADQRGVLSTANNWVDYRTARHLGARIIPAGSILYARVGAALLLNQRCITGRACVVDDNVRAFEPQHGDPRYWRYLMLLLDMGRITNPGPVPSVSERQVAALRVPLPTSEEQRRIADFLDTETARIDQLVNARHRQMLLLDERLDAVRDVLLNSSGPEVRPTPLMYLTDTSRPIVYGIVQAGPEIPGGVPYIKTGDLGNLHPDSLSRTSLEIHAQYKRAAVHPGDIIMAMRASIGAVAVVPPELPDANLTQGTARIAPARGVSGRWLLHALQTRKVREQCDLRAVGSTFRTLNIWDLRRISIDAVPATRQEKLADRFEIYLAKHAALRRSTLRQVLLLTERRQALITAAVTGQFDVTTANGRGITEGLAS